jgi:hypothetical protein
MIEQEANIKVTLSARTMHNIKVMIFFMDKSPYIFLQRNFIINAGCVQVDFFLICDFLKIF